MSTTTQTALAQAIQEHVQDESPGSITGAWICLVETTNLDDLDHDDDSMYVTSHGSSFTTRGMVECYRHNDAQEDA